MDARTALHTAARSYCMERRLYWQQRGKDRSFHKMDPESQIIAACYQIAEAMLLDVESIVPSDICTLDRLRSLLLMGGNNMKALLRRVEWSDITRQALQQERKHFRAYLQSLTAADLLAIKPLPYRRVLNETEHAHLWAGLRERWGVGAYWYPLAEYNLPSPVEAFQQAWFDRFVPPRALQHTLAEHGVARLWELREYGPEYEIELAELDPEYNGAEGYWTSGDMEWLVYASHESSITVGGGWLLAAVKAVWPEWEQHVYTGWDYAPPPPVRGPGSGFM